MPVDPYAKFRMQLHRSRRRQGMRTVRVLLHVTGIDLLIKRRLLSQERRNDREAIQVALQMFIDDALPMTP